MENLDVEIKTRLKEAQVKSDDQHFKKINIDSLNQDTLNALNDCVEKYRDPFPEQVMTQGVKEMMKINPYFHTLVKPGQAGHSAEHRAGGRLVHNCPQHE